MSEGLDWALTTCFSTALRSEKIGYCWCRPVPAPHALISGNQPAFLLLFKAPKPVMLLLALSMTHVATSSCGLYG